MLSEISFQNWHEEYRKNLKESLENHFVQETKLDKFVIKDIFVTGTRVYTLPGYTKNVFTKNSDLDVLFLIDSKVFEKYFELTQVCCSDAHKSKLSRFNYHNIIVSCFILPDNHIEYAKFYHWNLPLFSLYTGKVINYKFSHLYDYLVNTKRRIDPDMYCPLCKQEIESPIQLELKITSLKFHDLIEQNFLPSYRIFVCKKCFDRVLNDGLFSFLKDIEQNKNDTKQILNHKLGR